MHYVFVTAYLVLEVVAVYFAWRIISTARTPQGSVAWVAVLLAAPFIGVPAFLFLGHHKIAHYLVSRRESELVAAGIRDAARRHAPDTVPEVDPRPFEHLAELPVVRGNDMTLLVDGQATFDAIFAAIDDAQHYVLVQFYIVRDDDLGRALRDRIVAAAERGVSVRLLFDPVGSHKLPREYYDVLRRAGVRMIDPRKKQRGADHRFQLNFRNHRKTVVVDGRVGFIGGHNVGDEYIGRSPRFGHWRDTHVALRGPIVAQLQLIFTEDWHWQSDEVIISELYWEQDHAERDMSGLIVATGPGDDMETGALFFFSAIAAARHRLWIASPYCVPDTDVLTALKHAALRGVDVRLLVPDVIDHRMPWLAGFAYFDELRETGVQILRYTDGFMHQKVVVVDETLAAIGTSNLDNRSFRLNFEAMAVMFDARAASDASAMLEADFQQAFRLEQSLEDQALWIRLGAPVARLFAPVL